MSLCNHSENSVTQTKDINYFILVTKYFIFRCRCIEEIPATTHFINYFKNRLKVKEAISNLKKKQKNNYNWIHL